MTTAFDSERLERYLRSVSLRDLEARVQPARLPFVTVSRQAGAGGRSLAEELVRQADRANDPAFWGWHAFDEALCRKVADDPRLKVTMEALRSERYDTVMSDYFRQLIAEESPQTAVYRKTFEVLFALASAGRAVLVGRAGMLVASGLRLGVHLRLVAPKRARIARMSAQFGVGEPEAERWIDEQDASRERLVRERFHQDIGDPLLYDAVFDTSRAPLEEIASFALALAARRLAEARALAVPR